MLVLVWITMNPMARIMVAGDPVTMWRRFAEVTVVGHLVVVRTLIDPRPLHVRCRLFLPMAAVAVVAVAAAGKQENFLNRGQNS
jgi:hypothetical protein